MKLQRFPTEMTNISLGKQAVLEHQPFSVLYIFRVLSLQLQKRMIIFKLEIEVYEIDHTAFGNRNYSNLDLVASS